MTADRCPLCGHDGHRRIASASWADVRAALATYAGRPLPDDLAELWGDGSVEIARCEECGLDHVVPVVEGSGAFYEFLYGGEQRYEQDRWDFGEARSMLSGTDEVADLGCGSGQFLASLGGVRAAVGVDPNPAAVAAARASGVDAILGTPADLAARHPTAFDVVTAFQALEHLGDVASLVRPATELLRPRGRLVVSVPNRERLPVNEDAVLDWPPHHVSRWAPEQLARLAEAFGLELVEVRCERRGPAGVARLLAYLAVAGLRGRDPVSVLPGQPRPRWTWSSLSRRHSMLAVLRRPGPVTPTTAPATPGT